MEDRGCGGAVTPPPGHSEISGEAVHAFGKPPIVLSYLDYKCNWASGTLRPHLGLLLPEWWIRTTLLFQEKPCMLWEGLPLGCYLGCRPSSLGLGWAGQAPNPAPRAICCLNCIPE